MLLVDLNFDISAFFDVVCTYVSHPPSDCMSALSVLGPCVPFVVGCDLSVFLGGVVGVAGAVLLSVVVGIVRVPVLGVVVGCSVTTEISAIITGLSVVCIMHIHVYEHA